MTYPGTWQPGDRVRCEFLGEGVIVQPISFDNATSEPRYLKVKFDNPVSIHYDAFAERHGNVTVVLTDTCTRL